MYAGSWQQAFNMDSSTAWHHHGACGRLRCLLTCFVSAEMRPNMALPFRKAPLPLTAVNISSITGLYTTPTTTCSASRGVTVDPEEHSLSSLDQPAADRCQSPQEHKNGGVTKTTAGQNAGCTGIRDPSNTQLHAFDPLGASLSDASPHRQGNTGNSVSYICIYS